MGELKDKMKKDMELKNLSKRTIKTYLQCMKNFARHYGKSPEQMGDDAIRDFLHYLLKEKNASQASISQHYSALKFFYQTTLGRDWDALKIPKSRRVKKLPIVLSKEEVADIFRAYGPLYREEHNLPTRYRRVMQAIEICRTAALGGHKYKCDACGEFIQSYNSCRNRHCPKCQSLDVERWLEARKKEVLPTHYFHVVFTIQENLRPLALRNQRVVYNILFKAVAETLKKLCKA